MFHQFQRGRQIAQPGIAPSLAHEDVRTRKIMQPVMRAPVARPSSVSAVVPINVDFANPNRLKCRPCVTCYKRKKDLHACLLSADSLTATLRRRNTPGMLSTYSERFDNGKPAT